MVNRPSRDKARFASTREIFVPRAGLDFLHRAESGGFEFNGVKPQQERRKSVRRDFGLADDDSSRGDYSWSITKLSAKLPAFGVAGL